MGKKDKEHRKKVQARNEKLKAAEGAMQKIFQESMKRQLEELKRQREVEMSGDTKTNKMKWDLFNPQPEFNYKQMSTKIDVESLENPYIQVKWEDTPENFTQERIKSVKQYFQKKYNSTNINVITKVKTTDDTQQTIDVSVNIMDKNYQKELIKSMLESKGQEQYYDQVIGIDSAVENRMAANDVEFGRRSW